MSPSTSRLPRLVLLHRLLGLLALLAALLVATAAAAATLDVPGAYATINAALTAAHDGDTILVAAGTYSAAGDLGLRIGKSITIASSAGAATTIIDCSSNYFADIEANATIRGFTFTNSNSGDLSPIDFEVSGTVDQCVFSNNKNLGGNGAAISIDGGTATVTSCTFDKNTGATITASGGNLTMTGSSFTNNNGQSGGGGGAFNVNTGTITISDTTFDHNTAGSNAGGVAYMRNGAFTCTRCTFSNNSGSYGGAVLCGAQGLATPCTFYNSVFTGNTASISGGAICGEAGSTLTTTLAAVDSVFIGNTAATDGAAIDGATEGSSHVHVNLTNVSLYGNKVTSGTATGVLSGGASTTTTIKNTIFYGDTAPHELSAANKSPSVSVSYTDIADPGYAGSNENRRGPAVHRRGGGQPRDRVELPRAPSRGRRPAPPRRTTTATRGPAGSRWARTPRFARAPSRSPPRGLQRP